MLLVSCTKATTSTATSTTTTTAIITATSTTAAGNWWDSLATPQYGGTMNLRLASDIGGWDWWSLGGATSVIGTYQEWLWNVDWATNPAVFPFKTIFTPPEYSEGQLAQSYEMTDPSTFIFHLRHGIHWQDIPPANGREFVASDVVFHFNRTTGNAGGFTKPSGAVGAFPLLSDLSVSAPDDYTVVFKATNSSPESISEGLLGQVITLIESPDEVKQYGDTSDWHHAIGTGPFMVSDYQGGTSVTLVKNPNYWGYDERYPQNKLPYVDSLQYFIIPDSSTALGAMRTGKLDLMDGQSLQNSKDIKNTNSEILQTTYPPFLGLSVEIRNDMKPFSDLKVRQALQMSINLPEIAATYYGGTVDPTPETLTSSFVTGWGYPYSQWPQSLKDEYAFNVPQAKTLLTAAGYANGFNTDVVAMTTADLNLLQIIKGYFAAINVNMDIQTMDQAQWTNYVQTNKKYDALAFRDTGELGGTIAPIDQLQNYYSKDNISWAVVNDPAYDAIVDKAMAATSTTADVKQALLDANKLIAEQHYSISLLQPLDYAFWQPWLNGYSGQLNSISGNLGSGASPSIYLARFWIDTNLKKSMGH